MYIIIAAISVTILSGFVFLSDWDVSPSSAYFSNVPFGEYREAEFTVTSADPIYKAGGGTVSITGDNPEYFSCVSGCYYYLEEGEDHVVTIRFTAPQCPEGSTSNYGATIEFPTDDDDILGWIAGSVSGPDPCED
jgi:hypothetical protein